MSRYRSTSPVLVIEDFTNHLDQVIKPGDDVVAVTTGHSHRVSIKRAVYLGTKNKNVSLTVIEKKQVGYKHKETDVAVDFSEFSRLSKEYAGNWPHYNPADGYEVYAKAAAEHSAKVHEFYAQYKPVYVDAPRNTTLQLNRIYKIDTSIFDLKL